MVRAELQASYRQLRRSTARLLRKEGFGPDSSPEFAYAPADEEAMAIREFDLKTFMASGVPEIKNMWADCEEQARMLEKLMQEVMIENWCSYASR